MDQQPSQSGTSEIKNANEVPSAKARKSEVPATTSGRRRRTDEERELDDCTQAPGFKGHRQHGYRPECGQRMDRKGRGVGMGRDTNRTGTGRTLRVGMDVRGFQPGEQQEQKDTHQRQALSAPNLDSAHHLDSTRAALKV